MSFKKIEILNLILDIIGLKKLLWKAYHFLHKHYLKAKSENWLAYRALRAVFALFMKTYTGIRGAFWWCSKQNVEVTEWIYLSVFLTYGLITVCFFKLHFFNWLWFEKVWIGWFWVLPCLFINLKKDKPEHYFNLKLFNTICKAPAYIKLVLYLNGGALSDNMSVAVIATLVTVALKDLETFTPQMRLVKVLFAGVMFFFSTGFIVCYLPWVIQLCWIMTMLIFGCHVAWLVLKAFLANTSKQIGFSH